MKTRSTPSATNPNVQTYRPRDDADAPAPVVWKFIILGCLGVAILMNLWLFSDVPGDLSVNGDPVWSSEQTWFCAIDLMVLSIASLLVWLKG